MDTTEKIAAFALGVSPDQVSDEIAKSHLTTAESMVLNQMYPYGYKEGTKVPARYERHQIALAIELYTKRGAEGQVSHAENGTTRTWPTTSQILSQILPHCGSVMPNA